MALKKFCPKLWNARTSNEVQHVENWQIFFNNLSTFKIDLRKLWNARTSNAFQRVENLNIDPNILITFNIDLRDSKSQGPVSSFRRAHRRRKMKPYMMLKSTETIAIEDAFPSRAPLLLAAPSGGGQKYYSQASRGAATMVGALTHVSVLVQAE